MALPIRIVSDVVCPWCYIGKRRLERALARRPDLEVDVRWLPYQLDPTLPLEGVDRDERLLRKFGSPEMARAMYDRVGAAGREEGIDFRFAEGGRISSTLRAHCLIDWAGEAGVQDRVVTRLFEAFFEELEDVGSIDVLVSIAAEAGMDADDVRARLERGDDLERIRAQAEHARDTGITGVPFYFIDRLPVMGAQPADTFLHVIDRALDRRRASAG